MEQVDTERGVREASVAQLGSELARDPCFPPQADVGVHARARSTLDAVAPARCGPVVAKCPLPASAR